MNLAANISLYANRKLHDRIVFQGLQISIENRKGSVRQGVDPNTGKKWRTKMHFPYGYILKTMHLDGDHVDCYIGPNPNADTVYIVNQNVPTTGKFDEQKCMLGFDSADAAKNAYHRQYDNPKYFGGMIQMPFEKFKQKVLATKDNPAKIAAGGLFV